MDDHSRFVVAARFAFAETTLALEGVLRTGFLALGLPDRLYVDYADLWVMPTLARSACSAGAVALAKSA